MTLDTAPKTKPEEKKGKAGAVKGSRSKSSIKKSNSAQNSGDATSSDTGTLKLMRLSDPAEIDFVMPLMEAGHRETRYGFLPFSQPKARKRLEDILSHPRTNVGFYVLLGERPIGAVDVGLGEPFLAAGGLMGTCRSFYVHADVRSSLLGGRVAAMLASQAKDWAREKGAMELMFYDRQGFLARLLKGGEVDGANVVVEL